MNSEKKYAKILLKLSSYLMIVMGLLALFNAVDAFVMAFKPEAQEDGTLRWIIVFCVPPLMRAWAMISTGVWGLHRPSSTIFCRSLSYALVATASISLSVSLYEQIGNITAIGVHLGTLCNMISIMDVRLLKWHRRIEWARLYHVRWQDYSAFTPDYGFVRTAYAMLRDRMPKNKKRSLR